MARQSSKLSLWVIVVLLALLLAVRGFRSGNGILSSKNAAIQSQTNDHEPGKKSTWRLRKLVYTKHARCRMDCRNISESEVESIQKSGTINYKKSALQDSPCPAYAVEGVTGDGQHVRIVFGACRKITTVITCIDLDNEYSCTCD